MSTEEPAYIAKAFDKTQTYGVGEYVFYDNDLYKAKGFVPAHDFTPSEWEKVKVMEEIVNQEVSLDAIAPTWFVDETSRYQLGDFVIKDGLLYKLNSSGAIAGDNHTTWNRSYWDDPTVTEEIKNVNKAKFDNVGVALNLLLVRRMLKVLL